MNNQNSDAPQRSRTQIQSVSRAVGLISAIVESDDALTAKELSASCGLSLPTTYHLLTTLLEEGMLTKDRRRGFRLGPLVERMAQALERSHFVPEVYVDALHEIVELTGETAYLGAWREGVVKVLETVEGARAVRVVGLTDAFAPQDIHARASGKLFLAMMDEKTRLPIIDKLKLRRLTPHTITQRRQLIEELAVVRDTGIAFDREEFQLEVKCVSAPIWRDGRMAACITLSSPAQRFDSNEESLVSDLLSVTRKLSRTESDPRDPKE